MVTAFIGPISVSFRISFLKDGGLKIANVTKADAGIYTCLAENQFGSANDSTHLVVTGGSGLGWVWRSGGAPSQAGGSGHLLPTREQFIPGRSRHGEHASHSDDPRHTTLPLRHAFSVLLSFSSSVVSGDFTATGGTLLCREVTQSVDVFCSFAHSRRAGQLLGDRAAETRVLPCEGTSRGLGRAPAAGVQTGHSGRGSAVRTTEGVWEGSWAEARAGRTEQTQTEILRRPGLRILGTSSADLGRAAALTGVKGLVARSRVVT